MKTSRKRRSGVLMVVSLLLGVAAGGCNRASDTSSTGNTSGMTGPATGASSASGLTGPAVTPAPAPPQGASG